MVRLGIVGIGRGRCGLGFGEQPLRGAVTWAGVEIGGSPDNGSTQVVVRHRPSLSASQMYESVPGKDWGNDASAFL